MGKKIKKKRIPGGRVPLPQVAQDVIEELCCEMGLQRPEAFEEYILFVVTDRGEGLLDVPPPTPNGCRRGARRHAEAAGAVQGKMCGR